MEGAGSPCWACDNWRLEVFECIGNPVVLEDPSEDKLYIILFILCLFVTHLATFHG